MPASGIASGSSTTLPTLQGEAKNGDADDFYTAIAVRSETEYLAKLSEPVKQRTIPWEGYARADLITNDEWKMIQAYDRQSAATQNQLISAQGDAYITLFLKLLQILVRVDTVQYILIMISDIIFFDAHNLKFFNPNDKPCTPFVKCIGKDDEFIKLKAAHLLSILLGTEKSEKGLELGEFWGLMDSLLDEGKEELMDLGLMLASNVSSSDEMRLALFQYNDGKIVAKLAGMLPKLKQQNQYQVIFLIWQLSFNKTIATVLADKQYIIPTLMDIAKSAIKEKVIRVILATFRNLAQHAPDRAITMMIGAKCHMSFGALEQRKFTDEDIEEDLTFLYTKVKDQLQELSTFDEYSSEIRSGRLEWSPAHRSEQFWKYNAHRLNEQNRELLRILARILATSQNYTVLAIASHDIGQYVKYYPAGKKSVENLGAKQKIMELMTSEDADVRYEALAAVQKYMVHSAA